MTQPMFDAFQRELNAQCAAFERIEKLESQPWFQWLMAGEQNTCPHPEEYWVNEGWAGPESGGDGGTCRLCGWGFRHIYY